MKEDSMTRSVQRLTIGMVGTAAIVILVFALVQFSWLDNTSLGWIIMIGAVIQFVLQVVFFLHLHEEQKPRWQTFGFLFTALSVLIIVIGSLWIMMNMNYNMHISPEQMTEDINKLNKKGF